MNISKNIKISLITVHYKCEKKVAQLCHSLIKHPPKDNWELIIVDNNSGEKSLKQLKKLLPSDPHLHLIPLQKNEGFGKGNESGVDFARGEILVFINPDIKVRPHTLDILKKHLTSHSRIGIVTPTLTTEKGKPLPNAWDFPSFWGLLKKRLRKPQKIKESPKNPFPVDWAQGSFLMMHKKFFLDLGGFDPRFFLFLEDTDLCRRSWEKGFSVIKVPTAQAFHEEKRLSGEDLLSSMKKKTFWIHVHSAFKYFWKWRGQKVPQKK